MVYFYQILSAMKRSLQFGHLLSCRFSACKFSVSWSAAELCPGRPFGRVQEGTKILFAMSYGCEITTVDWEREA